MHHDLGEREKECDLRLVTLGAGDPRTQGQPWVMTRDGRGPLSFQGVTIRRQLKNAKFVGTRAGASLAVPSYREPALGHLGVPVY